MTVSSFKKNIFMLNLYFLFLVLTSCVPENAPRNLNSLDDANAVNDQSSPTPNSQSETAISENSIWRNSSGKSLSLLINFDNTRSHFIFGDDIDSYLKRSAEDDSFNYEQDYCLVIQFSSSAFSNVNELRVRAIASSGLSTQNGTERERYFRANLSSDEGNSLCNKTIINVDSTITSPPANLVTRPSDVCPTCSFTVSSNSLKLYQYDRVQDVLRQVSSEQVKIDRLSLSISMNGQTPTAPITCSDSQCRSAGFDCCIEGQCVNNKGLNLSGISKDPAGFNLAETLKATNPNWYKDYPQFYYACLDIVSDDPADPLDPSDPLGDASERVENLFKDHECIEKLRNNSEEDPYTLSYLNPNLNLNAQTQNKCSSLTSDPLYYQSVLKRLYDTCGCSEKESLLEMAQNCPAYYYQVIYKRDNQNNATSEIEDIICFIPPVDNGPTPFEDRNVSVSSKSAPHRFFNTDNIEINPETIAQNQTTSNTTQEGTPFQYLDESKLFPVNGTFNMNSILGNLKVNLSEARPAKIIDIEFDKVYYIAAIDGYYTPCPSCSKDFWFTNFSAFPSTFQGHGVRATGYTTSRSSWGSNVSLANYEDLIFGRACWVPPTMLPYSHLSIGQSTVSTPASANSQRLGRLEAQAALYVNGYQRDWYGFNRGALIGSFDGVTWFAIGKNRIVRSTSTKLFLAINAPFADLANPNDHTVHIAEYDFLSTGAKYDYLHSAEINDVNQNDGGLCQRYHQCETDTDCITQLGWEYVCSDVNLQRTKWPNFTPEGAIEINDDERVGTIVEFLQQGELPPSSTTSKRCVYRGAGSPCRVDYENIANYSLRKSLACAPNFYCARLNSNKFNVEVARFGNSLDAIAEPKNHLIGRDANVLGRVKNYIEGRGTLTRSVRERLEKNLQVIDPSISGNEGLCLPGKSLPDYVTLSFSNNTNFIEQQKTHDEQGRTDYISQISGCNASMHTIMRYTSCPMIDEDGDYLHYKDSYINDSVEIDFGFQKQFVSREVASQFTSLRQNACGLENIDPLVTIGQGISEESLRDASAFRQIEARDLTSSDTQIAPTLVQNACFRRGGAVCHTDLDCSPGKKHFDIIDTIAPDLFGNLAERKYWEEYLVCGQARPEPLVNALSTPDEYKKFNEWKMSNNRCCREVGKDMTIYSEDIPNIDESKGLRTDIYGGPNANHPDRYSRFMSASPRMSDSAFSVNNAFVADDSFFIRPNANTERNELLGTLSNSVNITNPNQWIPISEAASRTCCGGGWVRKFADGSNNWSINRLNLDVSQLRCLNYKTPLYLTETPEAFSLREQDANTDFPYLCVDPDLSGAGCAQHSFDFGTSDTPKAPKLDDHSFVMKIDSDLTPGDDGPMNGKWEENPFVFFGFRQSDNYVSAAGDFTVMNWSVGSREEVEQGSARQMLALRIPSFMTFENSTFSDSSLPVGTPGFHNSTLNKVSMERPGKNESGMVECKRIVDPDPLSYDCNDPNSWGGLCNFSMTNNNQSPSSEVTWYNTINSDTSCNYLVDTCCYMLNEYTRELRVTYMPYILCEKGRDEFVPGICDGPGDDEAQYYGGKTLSLELEFVAAGSLLWETQKLNQYPGITLDEADLSVNGMFHHRRSSTPGNAIYYLEKLAKFEYLGIPQMTYEPLFCNDNYQKMVPGLFKNELDNSEFGGDDNGLLTSYDWMNSLRTFIDNGSMGAKRNWTVEGDPTDGTSFSQSDLDPSAYYGDNEYRVATMEEVDHPKIFSSHEFKCCLPLGETVSAGEDSLCCSGKAVELEETSSDQNSNPEFKCALPTGTDLHVFYNRFISGEGLDVFESTDFNPRTGELRISVENQNKLRTLGEEHCEGGSVIQGGAFGSYAPEPVPAVVVGNGGAAPTIMSIVDSQYDNGVANNIPAGYNQFSRGYRWNHHLYCAPNQGN